MNSITKRIEIDLYSPASYEVIKAQQGDSLSRIIEFELYDRGEPFHIPENAVIYMEGHRGDNTFFEPKPCTASGNIITAALDSDILFESGTAEAKIVLYDPEQDAILSTIPFTISIQKHPCGKNKIESAKRSVIDWLTLNLEKLKKRAASTESAVKEETRRASDAEETITENLNQETARAAGKENEISDSLAEETERASHAENELEAKKADLDSPSLTGIPTAPTAPAGTDSGQIATTSFVHTAVSDGIAASDALVFKGTVGTNGTVDALPASYKTGWTYRVTAQGVYAGEICEAGDLIIALKDSDGSEGADSDWCVAQTNIDGAVTEIKSGNDSVECSRSGSSVSILHSDTERTDTASAKTLTDGCVFTAVKSISSDKRGHVTGVETEDIAIDFSASGTVTGVKGNEESAYRGGNVNLTAENIGALPLSGGTMTGRMQIPAAGVNWDDGKDIANASIGVRRPYVPSAYFPVIAGKTISGHTWNFGAILENVGLYGFRSDVSGVPPASLEMNVSTGAVVSKGPVYAPSFEGKASRTAGIQSMQIDGTDYQGAWYLIKSKFDGVGFRLFCDNNKNDDPTQYGIVVDHAVKATFDTAGNVIKDYYAKKSIYGDTTVSMGRKSGSTVGVDSFAFGDNNTASGYHSSVLGGGDNTTSNYGSSVLGGYHNTASGYHSSVLGGNYNTANGDGSSVLGGSNNTASGYHSSVLGGEYNTASNYSSSVLGKFSKEMNKGGSLTNQAGDAFVIGNGTNSSRRSNALRVTFAGAVYGTGAFNTSGADYAEFIKPWADGNPDNEDRVGYFVTIKDGFLQKADSGDYIAGITSGNPSVVGNADEDYYWRYERDEFNRIVMEDVSETVQKTDENGNPVFDEETHEPVLVETGKIQKNARMKLADDYDPSQQDSYIERKYRKEWDYVGMVGVLPVRDDGTCLPGHYCRCGKDGIATLAEEMGFFTYMVIERISDTIISVIFN